MDKTISIVFGTANRKHTLKKLLASIPQAAGKLDYEIVVTDGGSTDGTLETLQAAPHTTVIEHGELRGPVVAYNDAFRQCQGDYVAYINDDLEFVGQGVLEDAALMLQHDALLGVVSLPYVSSDDLSKKVVPGAVARPDGEHGESFNVASFGVLRRQDGEEAGWFGGWFYHYHGDSHLCLSLHEKGMRTEPLKKQAAYHHRLNNAVRGFAWEITGAKTRSQHDGLLFNALWGGYNGGPTSYGIDKRLVEVLRDTYQVNTFIETGTYRGETSEWAAGEFEQVFTIENDRKRYERVQARLMGIDNLHLIFGDSRRELKRLLQDGSERKLLWLDAHCRDWSGKRWEGQDQNPLKDELKAAMQAPRKPILLIDDAWWISQPPPFADYDPEQWPRLEEIQTILQGYDVLPRHGWNLFTALPQVDKPVGRF